MPDLDTVRAWHGRTLVDRDGDRIGTVDSIYLDDQTGQPMPLDVLSRGTREQLFLALRLALELEPDVVLSAFTHPSFSRVVSKSSCRSH